MKFHGVGPATAAKMNRFGIETGLDLKAQSLAFLQKNFGKIGPYYYGIARGIDDRRVCVDRARKSVGAESTFAQDIYELDAARETLKPLVDKVWGHCAAEGIRGKTVTLKVKYADFQQATRNRTNRAGILNLAELEQFSYTLLDSIFPVSKGVRLLGVSLSSFGDTDAGEKHQLKLPL